MITTSSRSGHSAQVKMSLLLDGVSLPVAQLGPGFLFLDSPIDHPPGEGRMIFQVDQSEKRWNVRLPNGISSKSKRVRIS
jgi:hypothetical protein